MKLIYRFFERVHIIFRTLQWKLAFSYILITIVALLVAMVVTLLVIANYVTGQYPQATFEVLHGRSVIIEEYMRQGETSQTDLDNALYDIDYGVQIGYVDQNTGFAAVIPTQSGFTTLTDAQGVVIDSTDPDIPAGSHFLDSLSASERQIFFVAQSGKIDKTQTVLMENQTVYAATPLRDNARKVIGVVYTRQNLPDWNEVIFDLLPMLWPTLLFITLLVGIIGTFFGLIMSRWLVKRFQKVTQAAENWSEGDFSVVIKDGSNDELGLMGQQLNRMSKRLELLLREHQSVAVLEERNRLARDLHDTLKQQIFAVAMQVWSAQTIVEGNTEGAKERLNAIDHLLAQMQQELSSLIHHLRPIALVEKSFADAIDEYCQLWAKQHSLKIELELAQVQLPLKVEEALYRLTQESLSNIARHSQASRVELQLRDEEELVRLSIRDDGHGFEPGRVSGQGVGLLSMRERMAALGGRLMLTSAPGEGTCILAIYPKQLEKAHPEPLQQAESSTGMN